MLLKMKWRHRVLAQYLFWGPEINFFSQLGDNGKLLLKILCLEAHPLKDSGTSTPIYIHIPTLSLVQRSESQS